MPEAHCPEEVEDLRQWSLVGDGVRTWVHVHREVLHKQVKGYNITRTITFDICSHNLGGSWTYHQLVPLRFCERTLKYTRVARVVFRQSGV